MSALPFSPATQTALLLCSPLRAGLNKDIQPLSLGEFNELERQLQRSGAPLEHLLEAGAAWLHNLSPAIDVKRIASLLERGFRLSLAAETWQSAGIWVVSRGQSDYPERFQRLKQNAPPVIYGCGEPRLLAKGGLAIVGSRDVDAPGERFTRGVASKAAREGMQIVSGGARGVDQLAMLAALDGKGTATGVLADSLLRSSTAGKAREAIQDGRLALISPFDPEAGFNVGNAMQRNKQIYALADFALVVSSGCNEGGTWSGAIEQLEKFHLVPVFARGGDDVPDGNRQLLRRGALSFPSEPESGLLRDFFEAGQQKNPPPMETADLFALHETPADYRRSRGDGPRILSQKGKPSK
jgi:predicted Rossmann fold nucleotide-binding protein DprA/Smf involved in DNA uptake